ncbi:T9SS type A sorting domain-containing protein, partial [Fulvivirga sedimenti]
TDGSITATAGGGDGTYEYSLDNSTWQTSNVFNGLGQGNYTVYVRDGAGTDAGCLAQDDVTLTTPDEVKVSITATVDCTQGPSGLPSGKVSVSGSGYEKLVLFDASDDSEVASQTTTGSYDFENLPSGSYYVIAYASDSQGTADACSATSETDIVETCYWTSLLKTTNGSVDPTRDWTFNLYQGQDAYGGNLLASATTLGDQDGVLLFNNINLDPNQTYTMCELNIPAGYSAVWWIDTNNDGVADMIVPAYNPQADENPMSDVGNRCFDFGAGTAYPLLPNSTLVFAVDNTMPGGAARTPGYWKNWNTCTSGGQADNAAKNGGYANGYWLLDDILNNPGITLGEFTIPANDCETGVLILDQRDLSGRNKKMANDAAYTLAMHLMAFKLNQAAGAYHCQYAIDAAMQADALLTRNNYDGTGSYLRPKAADYTEALELAGILDAYNNNILSETECSMLYTGIEEQPQEAIELNTLDVVSYPNPFRDQTTLSFSVSETSEVQLVVYDLRGVLVDVLYKGEALQGNRYEVVFRPENLNSNVYIYQLQTPKGMVTGKLLTID